MPSICLLYGFAVALGGFPASKAFAGVRDTFRKSENSVIMRIAAVMLLTVPLELCLIAGLARSQDSYGRNRNGKSRARPGADRRGIPSHRRG